MTLAILFVILGVQTELQMTNFQVVQAKRMLSQLLGLPALALTYECTSTRSLIEGICGCLSDIPGGYCYHLDCDLISPPPIPTAQEVEFLIERAKEKKD